MASKLGRKYRIQKGSIDLLLWATRTREDITLRNYTSSEVDEFLKVDKLDKDAQGVVKRFLSTAE